MAASTTTAYVLRSRRFVIGYGHGADLGSGDVMRAVLLEAGTVLAGSAQFSVVALRSAWHRAQSRPASGIPTNSPKGYHATQLLLVIGPTPDGSTPTLGHRSERPRASGE